HVQRLPAHHLRGHDDPLVALAQELADEALGTAVAVDVGGVDEVDACVDGGVQRRERLRVVRLAPAPAGGPGPDADVADLASGLAEGSRSHRATIEGRYVPKRRWRCWNVRTARSRSSSRNAGQYASAKYSSLCALCQGRNPLNRCSPLVRMIRSG